jgi:aspartate racemase
MPAAAPPPVLGVLGGMGPVASAEFLKTLYRAAAFRAEQAAPACILLSDPRIPDRTAAIRAGREDEVMEKLVSGLDRLERAGATRTLAACVTLHHWLPRLAPERRRRLISLVDVVADELRAAPARTLVLCTSGARQARVFERHPGWGAVADRAVFPSAGDQERVHGWVFAIKAQRRPRSVLREIGEMMGRYGAERWVAGCTELHLPANALRAHGCGASIVDPLFIVATRLDRFMEAPSAPRVRVAPSARVPGPELPPAFAVGDVN